MNVAFSGVISMMRLFSAVFSMLIVSSSPSLLVGQVSEIKNEENRNKEPKEVPIPNLDVREERVLKRSAPSFTKLQKEVTEEAIRSKLEESLGNLKNQFRKVAEREFAMKSKQLSLAIEALELAIKQFDSSEEVSSKAIQGKQTEMKAALEELASKASQLLAVTKTETANIAGKRSEIVAEFVEKKALEEARATAANIELPLEARPIEAEALKKLAVEQKRVAEQSVKKNVSGMLEEKLGEELARKSTERVAERVAGLKSRFQEIENVKESTSARLEAMEQRLSKMEEMLQKLLERK